MKQAVKCLCGVIGKVLGSNLEWSRKLKREPKFIQNLDLKICILDPTYVILKNCHRIIVIDLKRPVWSSNKYNTLKEVL